MITVEDMARAREAWGAGLIEVSKVYLDKGIDEARTTAEQMIDALYGYNLGDVLFKPTLAQGQYTFRPTRQGALAYFVAHDPAFPLDTGFALKGWVSMSEETSAQFIEGDVAMWMGKISLTNGEGEVTSVDKSFGYKRDADGALRLVLHHSSLPYTG
jgi:hypothetical protein